MSEIKIKKLFSFNTKIDQDNLFEEKISKEDIIEVIEFSFHKREEFKQIAQSHLKKNLDIISNKELLLENAVALFNSFYKEENSINRLLNIIRHLELGQGAVAVFTSNLLLRLYTSKKYDYTTFFYFYKQLVSITTYYPESLDNLIAFYHHSSESQKRSTLRILVEVPNSSPEYTSFIEQEAIKALHSKDKESERIGLRYLSTLSPSKATLIALGIPFLLKYKTYDDVYNDYGLKLSKVKKLSDVDLKALMKAVPTLPLATHVKDPYMHHNCGSQLEERVDKLLILKDKWDAGDWKYVEERGYYRFLLPSLYIRYEENPNKAITILKKILESTKTYTMHGEQMGTTKDILTFLVAKQHIDKAVVDVVFYILLNKKEVVASDISFYLMILKNYPDLHTHIEPLSQLIENHRSSRSFSALFHELIETAAPKNPTLRSNLLQQIQ